MPARSLLLGLAWMALALGRAQEMPPPAPAERLDAGLLEPEWFGAGPVWSGNWRVDFFWVRPGARWEQPVLYLCPWEEPRFLSNRGPLDYAAGWQAAEFLQDLLRTRLGAMPGIRLAATPDQTPYHAMGRIVEATHIRQGALATFGIMAGLPSFTWDFKVVDTRTSLPLLASHHRSIAAPASTWVAALEPQLRQMAGLPSVPAWQTPSDRHDLEDGSWTWTIPDLHLPAGCLEAGPWTADTDTGGLWKAWTNGLGTSLAQGLERGLRVRVARSPLAKRPQGEPIYLLTGQVYTSPKYLKTRYRAQVLEEATGRVVARHEIRSPIGLPDSILRQVAERIVSHLEALQVGTARPSEASSAATPPARPPDLTPWVGLDHLAPGRGGVDRAWVSPAFRLAGRSLQVADWGVPALSPESTDYDRSVASWISSMGPAWIYGALASHSDRAFRIHRRAGDLRLEGRVIRLDQPDRGRFLTGLGGALTFGMSMEATGTLQMRVLDAQTGETLVLIEQELTSFQMASDGVPYKAFKWLAQDLVPWLMKEGSSPPQPPDAAEPSPGKID